MALLFAGGIFKLPTDLGGPPVWIVLDLALIVFTGCVLVFDIANAVKSRGERPGKASAR
jgi:hypothetical protein